MPARRWRSSGEQGSGSGRNSHDNGGPLRWLLTYADMITLLMAFFIMMYSISVLDVEKFRLAAASLRHELGEDQAGAGGRSVLDADSGTRLAPGILPFAEPQPAAIQRTVSFRKLQEYLRVEKLDELVRVRAERRGLVISLLADGLLFPAASAQTTGACRGVLDRLATVIKEAPNDVSIEGHTCDLPPRGGDYPSNWELSTARATQVTRYFIEVQQIPAARLSAAGYAASKPLAANDSARHRALNRRVDIVILGSYSR